MTMPVPEVAPTPAQRQRLRTWLHDLALISQRHQIVLSQVHGDIRLVDLTNEHLIGLDLEVHADDRGTLAVHAVDSILDGVWLVESHGAFVEQRTLPSFRDEHLRENE